MNTANWIPDMFMKRVMEGGDWTLFSPSDVPDLHDKWGKAFEEAYTRYEEKAARGDLKLHKKIPAVQLWRKMLSMLFETGHRGSGRPASARRSSTGHRAQLEPLREITPQHLVPRLWCAFGLRRG
jgi:hypothetical protein